MKTTPKLSSALFWDIEISKLSYDESAEWVIERVFDRGTFEEVLSVVNYYGEEKVKNHLINTPYFLPNHTILLAKAIFQLNFKDFKCLEKRPFP